MLNPAGVGSGPCCHNEPVFIQGKLSLAVLLLPDVCKKNHKKQNKKTSLVHSDVTLNDITNNVVVNVHVLERFPVKMLMSGQILAK